MSFDLGPSATHCQTLLHVLPVRRVGTRKGAAAEHQKSKLHLLSADR